MCLPETCEEQGVQGIKEREAECTLYTSITVTQMTPKSATHRKSRKALMVVGVIRWPKYEFTTPFARNIDASQLD